jgi:hypothetical protein
MSADLQNVARLQDPILGRAVPRAQAGAAENSSTRSAAQRLLGSEMADGGLSLNEMLGVERDRQAGSLRGSKKEHKLLLPILFTCLKYCT